MEEARSIDDYPAVKNKLPAGMIILMVYMGYSLVTRSIAMGYPILLFGPFLVPQVLVVIYYLVSVVIIGFCLWGVYKRKMWGLKAIIYWYGFGMIYVFINTVVSLYFRYEFIDIYKQIFSGSGFKVSGTMIIISGLVIPLILVFAVNTLIIWYVNKKKDYFVN